MIGTTVGHYAIESKLGEGGMSENSLRVQSTSSCNFQDPCLRARLNDVVGRAEHFGRQAPLSGGGML